MEDGWSAETSPAVLAGTLGVGFSEELERLLSEGRFREVVGRSTAALGNRRLGSSAWARLRLLRAQGLCLSGQHARARAEARRAADRATGDPLVMAQLQETRGLLAFREQRLHDACAGLSEARVGYELLGHRSGVARVLGLESCVRADMGALQDALCFGRWAVEAAARADATTLLGRNRAELGAVLMLLGRWDEASRELAAATREGHESATVLAAIRQAALELVAGDSARVPRELLRLLRSDGAGHPAVRAELLLVLSDARLAGGQGTAADEAASEAASLLGPSGDRGGECRARVRRAHALLERGQVGSAVREARRAVQAVPHESAGLRALAEVSLGRALLRSGAGQAKAAFERASTLSSRRKDLFHAAQAGYWLACGCEGDAVEQHLAALEIWGDRRLLALARADSRRVAVVRNAWDGAQRLGAGEEEPWVASLVDATLAATGVGDARKRWADALLALQPALAWQRASVLGSHSFVLDGPEGQPSPLEAEDPMRAILESLLQQGASGAVPSLGGDTAVHPGAGRDGPVHRLAVALSADLALGVELAAGSSRCCGRALSVLRAIGRLCGPLAGEDADGERLAPAFLGLIGRSPAMIPVFDEIRKAAVSEATVHIFGETGTGKERVARAIHAASRRGRGPFVAFNASSLSDELFDSTLFGHAKGAFTGAVSERSGLVAEAEGGTLFLDEIEDLSLAAQVKLLRFLQEREYCRVGENRCRRANVRVLSAANQRIEECVREGRFRSDLLFRLNVLRLELPPLRERGEDILLLAKWAVNLAAERDGVAAPRLGEEVLARLLAHPWPGNVRELENVMSRLVVSCAGGCAKRDDLSKALGSAAEQARVGSLQELKWAAEREGVNRALEKHGRHRGRAAAELGISRQALAIKLRRLCLS
jgi:DNA-binding NtrC family response regulator